MHLKGETNTTDEMHLFAVWPLKKGTLYLFIMDNSDRCSKIYKNKKRQRVTMTELMAKFNLVNLLESNVVELI